MPEQIGDDMVFLRLQQLKEGKIQYTDSSNALRLMREHGQDIRYNAAWKKWIVWTGKNWQIDEGYLIHERGMRMVRGIYDDVLKTDDYRERMEIEKYAMQSEAMRRRKAFIEAASLIAELNITANDVDKDPWLFNVGNGTIELKTGAFREHRRDDMITRLARVSYDGGADCPAWKQFIREIMNYNTDLTGFLQTAAGWALTGDTSEQTMFILYGSGANGKSTFLNTLMRILGDYAIAASTETFMKKNGDQISNDIARLRGTRFVTTAEAEQGKRLSEPLIKQITGNDAMTARFLYGEFFDFVPTFKIFMATNHKPMIRGTDHGIWRRIKLIPFTTVITAERQDKHLEEKLIRERPGILNCLIEGARRWFGEGLVLPPELVMPRRNTETRWTCWGTLSRSAAYRGRSVPCGRGNCSGAYQEWYDENNEHACSERFLSLRLKGLGLERARTAEARYWRGIGLRAAIS